MKLPDFCLTPLKSICFQSCCIHRQIHPLGCWDPRAWSVYQFKRPTYACAKNEAILCLCRFDLSAANNLSNRLPTTAHTRYRVRFRPHSRAKTAPISSFSHLCRIAFESVILNEFLDFGNNPRQNSCFFCHVMNIFCVWFIQYITFFSVNLKAREGVRSFASKNIGGIFLAAKDRTPWLKLTEKEVILEYI